MSTPQGAILPFAEFRRARACAWFLFAMTIDAVVYFARPGWHLVTWTALGVGASAAMTLGALRHRPSRRPPWILLSVAVLAFVSGDTSYNVLTDLFHQDNPFPSVADGLYLATYPLFAVALLLVIRRRRAEHDRGALIDAAVVTAGLALLAWVFLIVPYVRDDTLTVFQKMISVAYPLGDVLVIAMLARLITAGGFRTRPVQLLTLGSAGLLVSDALYAWTQLHGSWRVGGPVDLGWMSFYILWGAAALHPDMVQLTQPMPARPLLVRRRRLALLAVASLVAPAILFAQSVDGSPSKDGAVIAAFAVVLFLLVIARMAGLVALHQQAVGRERALRHAAGTLVSAGDKGEIWTGLVEAVESVSRIGSEASSGVVAIVLEPGLGADRTQLAPLPPELRARLTDRAAATVEPGDATVCALFAVPVEAATVCRLRANGATFGAVLVGGDAVLLTSLQRVLETIATLAGVALERVVLSEQVLLNRAEGRFRSLIQSASDMVVLLDEDERISYHSPSLQTALGHETDLVGTLLLDAVAEEHRAHAFAALRRFRRSSGVEQIDWVLTRADGQRVEVEVLGNDLRSELDVGGLVLTLRDVTDRRRLERELQHRAFHDALTGLANRDLFADRTSHALSRVRRDGGVVAVLLIDVDDFKVVNDTLGHAAGDELLLRLAERLKEGLRDGDTAARLGGDEFAVVLEDLEDAAAAGRAAQRIVDTLADDYRLSGESMSVSVSVGVSTSLDVLEATELLRYADLALYAAKELGKRGWYAFEADLHTGMLHRLEVRAGLVRALETDAFSVDYQPIVSLQDSGPVVGVEALVRWRSENGLISPADFIPVAEDTGLIVEIGAWVLRRALEDVQGWNESRPGARPLRLSVNVSPRQLHAGNLIATVHEALASSGFPAELLTLELTEGVLLHNDGEVARTLSTFRDMGLRIAVDDFGTGYSALGYLRDFPVTTLKVDRSFVSRLPHSAKDTALVEAIVRMAESLGLDVVAEGIEEPAQDEAIRALGCQMGQGYLYARPLPAAALPGFLDSWRTRSWPRPREPQPVPVRQPLRKTA